MKNEFFEGKNKIKQKNSPPIRGQPHKLIVCHRIPKHGPEGQEGGGGERREFVLRVATKDIAVG